MTTVAITAILAIVFGSAALRGLTGFGFALAAVPMLVWVMPPGEAVALVIILQVIIAGADVWLNWRETDFRLVMGMTAGAVIGTPVGVWLLVVLDPGVVQVLLGLIVGAGVFVLMLPRRDMPKTRSRVGAMPVGALSGLFGGLAAMPGPPAIAYALSSRMPPVTARASLIVFFSATSFIALPVLVVADYVQPHLVIAALISVPAMGLGHLLGTVVFRRTGGRHYRPMALAVLALMAVLATAQGLWATLGG